MKETPKFKFAVVERIKSLLPSSIEDKELTLEDFMPKRMKSKDTGYDARSAESTLEIQPYSYFKIRLGIRMFAPEGWWIRINPRSGLFINNHINTLYGIVDENFCAELCLCGQFLPDKKENKSFKSLIIQFGQRICQLVPVKRQDMDIDNVTNEEIEQLFKERNDPRGTSGFGGSGIK